MCSLRMFGYNREGEPQHEVVSLCQRGELCGYRRSDLPGTQCYDGEIWSWQVFGQCRCLLSAECVQKRVTDTEAHNVIL